MPLIEDIVPDKSTYRPGEAAHIAVRIANDGPHLLQGRLALALTDIRGVVSETEQGVTLAAGATHTVTFPVQPPAVPLRGYGLDATLTAATGQVLAEGSGALDVLERWSQAPRYGFLSQFAPGDGTHTERYDSLCRYHLNVVQFYDWMWRHYRLLPPTEEYTDALDRRMSLASVRAAIAGVQARGGAALAYGAVYGAEPEYALQHPDLMLYDEAGQPVSLAELFYIMNIAPGSAWLPQIIPEFAEAVRVLHFDGIHLDQYGFPKTARTLDGITVDLSADFPPLIDAARAAVVQADPQAGVIFNAVGNWPIDTVAPTTEDAVYIEVWPPDESYNDLHRLIRDGHRLGGGKPVILAAYLSPFASADATTVAGAEAAALLATATIAAAGGSHLLLGEQDGILCDPYYPKYATLEPTGARGLRAYYDFLVRYEEFLVAPDLADWASTSPTPPTVQFQGTAVGLQATAGGVWAIPRQKPGYCLLHLINLADQADIEWNALRTPPTPLVERDLTVGGLPPVRGVLILSPDAQYGRPFPTAWTQNGDTVQLCLPQLTVWTTVLFLLEDTVNPSPLPDIETV